MHEPEDTEGDDHFPLGRLHRVDRYHLSEAQGFRDEQAQSILAHGFMSCPARMALG